MFLDLTGFPLRKSCFSAHTPVCFFALHARKEIASLLCLNTQELWIWFGASWNCTSQMHLDEVKVFISVLMLVEEGLQPTHLSIMEAKLVPPTCGLL